MRLALTAPVLVSALLSAASCVRATPLPVGDDADRHDLPATRQDIQILELADQLLSSPTVWNRSDTRECPPGATRISLFCALQKASVQVLGVYEHRRVALQEVRFLVDARGKDYPHRLMGFNNDPSTSFSDVKAVLRAALERVQKRLKPS